MNRINRYILNVVTVLCLIIMSTLKADVNPELLASHLIEVIKSQKTQWPTKLIEEVSGAEKQFLSQAKKIKTLEAYEKLRFAYTQKYRNFAKQVYRTESLVWNVLPDDDFVMLSLPQALKPIKKTSLHTVVNALEATAFGVANFSSNEQSLDVFISTDRSVLGAPLLTPRVARFTRSDESRYLPDALLAMDGSHSIPSGESKFVWIGVESTDSVAGRYDYTVTIKIGTTTHQIPLQVIVHDIVLAKKTPLTTFNWAYLDSGYNVPVYKKVRETMLNHRITTGANTAIGNPEKDAQGNIIRPVEIDYSELDSYIEFNKDFPQISFFWSFNRKSKPPTRDMFGKAVWMSDEYKAIFREWLTKFVARLKQKGRDYDSFYLQMFDETTDDKLAQITELVHQIDPKIRMMITISSTANPQKILDNGMDIVVYHSPFLNYESIPDSFKVIKSAKSELWLYNAGNKTRNGRDRDPLNIYRLLHWLAFHHQATGVGFWNMFHSKQSGWSDDVAFYPLVYTVPDIKKHPIPTEIQTNEAVIPTRRLEYTRMGIEDYMLLQMTQKAISKLEEKQKHILQVKLDDIVKSVTDHLPEQATTKSRENFHSMRQLLINMLEKLKTAEK